MPDRENPRKSASERKTHRALELLETLRRLGGSARTSHLADIMNVSEETVRRTVKKLSRDGTVSRAHGGVYLALEQSSSPIHLRIREQSDQKSKMAAIFEEMVEDGASLFLDVGSTTIFVAEALRVKKNLTIVTNSLAVAQILMNHNQNRVFVAGGELEDDLGGTFGATTQKFVEKFTLDFAVLSCTAIDAKRGFLLDNPLEAELAHTFISRADKSVVLADSSKIGQRALMVACDPCDVDSFITDLPLPAELSKAMKQWKVEVFAAQTVLESEKRDAANSNLAPNSNNPADNTGGQIKKKKRK